MIRTTDKPERVQQLGKLCVASFPGPSEAELARRKRAAFEFGDHQPDGSITRVWPALKFQVDAEGFSKAVRSMKRSLDALGDLPGGRFVAVLHSGGVIPAIDRPTHGGYPAPAAVVTAESRPKVVVIDDVAVTEEQRRTMLADPASRALMSDAAKTLLEGVGFPPADDTDPERR